METPARLLRCAAEPLAPTAAAATAVPMLPARDTRVPEKDLLLLLSRSIKALTA
jgi:hypothetical protein